MSILPSVSNVVCCIIAGMLTVAIGIYDVGVRQDMIPGNLQLKADWLPFIAGFNHGVWQGLWTFALWLLALVLLFVASEFLFGAYAKETNARNTERQWLLRRAYGRLFVALCALVLVLAVTPGLHWVSAVEKLTAPNALLIGNVWHIAIAAVLWAIIYYGAVVFVRLCMFRVRIFAKGFGL